MKNGCWLDASSTMIISRSRTPYLIHWLTKLLNGWSKVNWESWARWVKLPQDSSKFHSCDFYWRGILRPSTLLSDVYQSYIGPRRETVLTKICRKRSGEMRGTLFPNRCMKCSSSCPLKVKGKKQTYGYCKQFQLVEGWSLQQSCQMTKKCKQQSRIKIYYLKSSRCTYSVIKIHEGLQQAVH